MEIFQVSVNNSSIVNKEVSYVNILYIIFLKRESKLKTIISIYKNKTKTIIFAHQFGKQTITDYFPLSIYIFCCHHYRKDLKNYRKKLISRKISQIFKIMRGLTFSNPYDTLLIHHPSLHVLRGGVVKNINTESDLNITRLSDKCIPDYRYK